MVTTLVVRQRSSMALEEELCIIMAMARPFLLPPTPPGTREPATRHRFLDAYDEQPIISPLLLVPGGRYFTGSMQPCDS